MSMGCAYAIVAYGADAARAARASSRPPSTRWTASTGSMSHYKPDSPLSRLNREAGRGPGARRAGAVRLPRRVACATAGSPDGAFDITVGPADEGLGLLPRRGPPAQRRASSPRRAAASGTQHVVARPRPSGRSASTGPASSWTSAASPRATRSIARWLCSGRAGRAGRAGQRRGQHDLRPGRAARAQPAWDVEVQDPRRTPEPVALHGRPEGPRALGLRQLREVVRGGRRAATRTSWTRAPGGRCRAC